MTRVDVHWHHAPKPFVKAVMSGAIEIEGKLDSSGPIPVIEVKRGRVRITPAMAELEPAMAVLESSGMDYATPSLVPPLSQFEASPEIAINVARSVNDGFAELREASNDRLQPLAHLPLQDPRASVLEMRRALGELGLAGVAVGTNINGRNLGDESLRPFWRAVAEEDVFVFVHPENPMGGERLREHELRNFVGFPIDTAAAVASMIFDGVYEEVGPLKTVYAHGGGAFPYIFGRWEHGYAERVAGSNAKSRNPFSYLQSLYCDSLVHSGQSLRFLTDLVGVDHVLLGGDYPFNMGDPTPFETMAAVIDADNDRELIGGRTAARLLGLEERRSGR